MKVKHIERVRRPRSGSGSHNRSSLQNAEYGRKGGLAKVKKGLATLSPERLEEITSKGVKVRQARSRLQTMV